MAIVMPPKERWPIVTATPVALAWLSMRTELGLAARTIDAYGRGLSEYLRFCTGSAVNPVTAGTDHIARFVRHLTMPTAEDASLAPASSAPLRGTLANATLHQRMTVIRLFYDYLVEEGLRTTNPVGRGRHGQRRGLLPRYQKLPWIPNDVEWSAILSVARQESIRNRAMLALGYDAGLRREELCLLHTRDLDPATRTLRIRAETTKSRRERVVPYSAASGELLASYLAHRATLSRARGLLFLSESRRNYAQPLTLWTWSKVIRRIALEAGVPDFSTHTLRHLCLTDLARAGVELHTIAIFAGHRSPTTTLQYIHLSGRDLADKFARSMRHLHAWRTAALLEAPSSSLKA